jgi:hypothetical protein
MEKLLAEFLKLDILSLFDPKLRYTVGSIYTLPHNIYASCINAVIKYLPDKLDFRQINANKLHYTRFTNDAIWLFFKNIVILSAFVKGTATFEDLDSPELDLKPFTKLWLVARINESYFKVYWQRESKNGLFGMYDWTDDFKCDLAFSLLLTHHVKFTVFSRNLAIMDMINVIEREGYIIPYNSAAFLKLFSQSSYMIIDPGCQYIISQQIVFPHCRKDIFKLFADAVIQTHIKLPDPISQYLYDKSSGINLGTILTIFAKYRIDSPLEIPDSLIEIYLIYYPEKVRHLRTMSYTVKSAILMNESGLEVAARNGWLTCQTIFDINNLAHLFMLVKSSIVHLDFIYETIDMVTNGDKPLINKMTEFDLDNFPMDALSCPPLRHIFGEICKSVAEDEALSILCNYIILVLKDFEQTKKPDLLVIILNVVAKIDLPKFVNNLPYVTPENFVLFSKYVPTFLAVVNNMQDRRVDFLDHLRALKKNKQIYQTLHGMLLNGWDLYSEYEKSNIAYMIDLI